MIPTRYQVTTGLNLLRQLPPLFRHPLRPEHAGVILRRRLERRPDDFLLLVRRILGAGPGHPTSRLLRQAGCEYGDVARLVDREGVEGALTTLLARGVYLTVDEFKGKRPVVRGSATFAVKPDMLRNRTAGAVQLIRSGGSRGPGTAVPINPVYIHERAVDQGLFFDARGGLGWLSAPWGSPGGAALGRVVTFAHLGAPPPRWFSMVDLSAPGLHPRYRWSAHLVRWAGLLAGLSLPSPSFCPLDNPRPLLRWIKETLDRGRTPHVWAPASAAALACQVARDAGLDLSGAQFTISGEPVTAARLGAIRAAGAEAAPLYGSTETGTLGCGCLAPDAPDDLHQFHDFLAVVQAGPLMPGVLPPRALLVSSLRPSAPFLLLNFSLGDEAELVRRSCGCPLESLGWVTHLRTIRSFEKLTAGGGMILDADVIRVLEEVLPARFGGGPGDYQLLEQEAQDGRSEMRLLVHPRVGPIEPKGLAEAFLAAIGSGSDAQRLMLPIWQQAGFPLIERRPPLATESGKILHLHRAAPSGAAAPAAP